MARGEERGARSRPAPGQAGKTSKPAPRGCYWRGTTLWGRVTVRGIEHRFSLRTGNAAVAARRREAERERLTGAAHFGEQTISYEAAFIAWSEHVAAEIKASTAERYACSLAQIEPILRPLLIASVDRARISEIIRARRAQGAGNATIRRDLTALSRLLDFAEDEGWREGNPALDRLRKLKERRDPIVLPAPEDIRFVIARAPGLLARLIEAAWLTGCRQAELAGAARRQLDRDRRQLSLYATKTDRPRVLDLTDRIDAWSVFATLPASLATQALFWHGDGEPYRNVSSRFAALVRAARKAAQQQGRPFRPFRFHDLRHRHAVDYLKAGGSIYDLQHRLGHASIKTTELYLRYLTPEEARRAKHQEARSAERDRDGKNATAHAAAQMQRSGTGKKGETA